MNDETPRRTQMNWCDCRVRCGDIQPEHDRKGATCKALPGWWASLHEHRPVPASEPFDWECRVCGHSIDLHAREASGST